MMPLLLDWGCSAGGAAWGYHLAGFTVVGVDIEPQPHYPFLFVQMDGFQFLDKYGGDFDAIHASPPCPRYSKITKKANRGNHPDLIAPLRDKLLKLRLPFVIENVPGAPLDKPLKLCGCMFPELRVYRERWFETNFKLLPPVGQHKLHRDKTPRAGHGVSPKGYISITSGGVINLPDGWTPAAYKNMAMGIDWMTQDELTKAIPPAYTRYIGQHLQAVLH